MHFKLFLLMITFYCSSSYCQIGSLFDFGNAVYYKTEELSTENLRGTSGAFFDKKITNRFFDTYLKTDSIRITVEDTSYIFYQKKRHEPKEYKEIFFYRSRPFTNKNLTVKELKLIEINSIYITAEALMLYNSTEKTVRKKERILLPLNEVEGIFLGTGRNSRCISYGGGILGGFIAIFLITH